MTRPKGHQPPGAAPLTLAPGDPALRLLLSRRPSHPPASLDTTAPSALLDDERGMEVAEWVYFNAEEPWFGFKLTAEIVGHRFLPWLLPPGPFRSRPVWVTISR
ncbi:MAG: hypothetical protein ACT4PT_08030 [Methanobacteriota archaeon]